jgi:GAF domain-containing protein
MQQVTERTATGGGVGVRGQRQDTAGATGPREPTAPGGRMAPGGPWAGRGAAGSELCDIAGLVLEATVPAFADVAGVYVLEHLLTGSPPGDMAESTPGGMAEEAPGGVTWGTAANGGITWGLASGTVVARRLRSGFAADGRQVPDDAFPAGEVLALDRDSPAARCVTSATPVFSGPPGGRALARAADRAGGGTIVSRISSMLAVPVISGGTTVGMLVFGRTDAAPRFSDRDAAGIAALAERAGACIANSLLLTRQRTAGAALQRVLAAREPAVPPGIEVEGRCLPAPGHVVGGDWYDVISLPGPRTGLVVGDVMDHGPEAAALMAQLRTAAHALADVDLEPAEVLRRLDRTAATLAHVSYATCTYAVLDAAQGSCVAAAAGPQRPVLALPGGTTRVPRLPSGLPLGLGVAIYGQARFTVPPGAILALYTDGLVESRSRTSDEGILALRSALSRQRGALADACDALIRPLDGSREDDTTLLLARIPAGTPSALPAPIML